MNHDAVSISWPWEISELNHQYKIGLVADVYAATTNIPLILLKRARDIIVVNEKIIRKALADFPDAVCIGESTDPGIKPLFVSTNHPSDINCLNLEGKTVLYMTNNGTRVIEKLIYLGMEKIVAVSFVNVDTVSDWIKNGQRYPVLLLPAGEATVPETIPDRKAMEDKWCMDYLSCMLTGSVPSWKEYKDKSVEFILTHYPPLSSIDEDLRIVFDRNGQPVVPLVDKDQTGYIHIHSGLSER